MASSYVNDLRLNEMATGDASGTWGTTTNTNLELIGNALGYGTEAITTNADTHASTVADGAADSARAMYIKYTGTLDSTCTITIGPNTMKRVHIIENATSGSQSIIIKQGSGATITIPTGDTKVVMLDGAGSGAAVVDAFASLSVVDLKVQDDLTVTDDMTVGGTLGVTGVLTGTSLDISGDIDVDGTTNLDVVDIDGAVDMASTLQVDGAITNSSTIVSTGKITTDAGIDIDNINIDGTTIALSSGDLTLDVAGDIILDADGADIRLKDAGTEWGRMVNSSSNFLFLAPIADKDILFNGVDGSSEITALALDMSAGGSATFNNNITTAQEIIAGLYKIGGTTVIDGNRNLTNMGNVNGAAGIFGSVEVDNFTLDGTTLALSSGDFKIDVAGNIQLDADDAGEVRFQDNSTTYATIKKDGNNALFQSIVADGDFIIQGIDGSSFVSAVSFDMSNAGFATFNSSVSTPTLASPDGTGILTLANTGEAQFNRGIVVNEGSVDSDFRVESDGNANMLFVDGGNNRVGIGKSDPARTLDVHGSVEFSVNTASHETFIFTTQASNDAKLLMQNASAATAIQLSANGTTFLNGGNVNIGITGDQSVKLCIENGSATTPNLMIKSTHANAYGAVKFNNSNGEAGSISVNASSVAYNTSSDYRLKENVDYTWDATTRLKQLKPARFNFIADETNTLVDGFIAHEASTVVPESVTGEKDAVDGDGNPVVQGIDQSKLVPLLVKTIQELEARITALES